MLRLRGHEDDLKESKELHTTVSLNNYKQLHKLLSQEKYKKVINVRSGWGIPGTPLRLAASRGYLKCIKVLLAHGAEVDCVDAKAQTPLFTAVNVGHFDCVRQLLKAGANPFGSIFNNCSPILTAARDGRANILRELLEYGAEPNVCSKVHSWAFNYATSTGPMYLSAVYGHLHSFKILLLYGADPDYNCTDPEILKKIKHPVSLLEVCLHRGCKTQFVELLIDFGANLYLPDTHLNVFPNREALELLIRERGHPRTLMSLSRLAIRKLLRKRHLIDQLEIPKSLIKYLQHQN